MPNRRKPDQTTATFVIPKHLLAWVQQEAEKRGQSISEYIRNLILNQWDKFNEKQEKKGESSKENQSSRILPD
jgi:hypothetical protein